MDEKQLSQTPTCPFSLLTQNESLFERSALIFQFPANFDSRTSVFMHRGNPSCSRIGEVKLTTALCAIAFTGA
jgi:hypothetical protein